MKRAIAKEKTGACAITAVLVALLINTAHASSEPDLELIPGFQVPLYKVTELTLDANLTLDEVAVEVGRELIKYTVSSNFEACARFCKSETKIGVVVTTVKSHFTCMIVRLCPNGMTPFGADVIHSHPKAGTYSFTKVDRQLQGRNDGLLGNRWKTTTKETAHLFSDADLATSGYLVTVESPALYHHNLQSGRIRLVSKITTINDNTAANVNLAAVPKGDN